MFVLPVALADAEPADAGVHVYCTDLGDSQRSQDVFELASITAFGVLHSEAREWMSRLVRCAHGELSTTVGSTLALTWELAPSASRGGKPHGGRRCTDSVGFVSYVQQPVP